MGDEESNDNNGCNNSEKGNGQFADKSINMVLAQTDMHGPDTVDPFKDGYGNIICGSFLTVFSNELNIKIIEHVPDINFDMYGAMIEQVISRYSLKAGDALVIEVKFKFERAQVEGYVILILGIEEMKAIMGALEGVKA